MSTVLIFFVFLLANIACSTKHQGRRMMCALIGMSC